MLTTVQKKRQELKEINETFQSLRAKRLHLKQILSPLSLSVLKALTEYGEQSQKEIIIRTRTLEQQSYISIIIKRLVKANLIISRREGKFTYYKISE